MPGQLAIFGNEHQKPTHLMLHVKEAFGMQLCSVLFLQRLCNLHSLQNLKPIIDQGLSQLRKNEITVFPSSVSLKNFVIWVREPQESKGDGMNTHE